MMSKIKEIEWHAGHWKVGTGARGIIDEVEEARRVVKRCHEIMVENSVPSTTFFDDVSKNQSQNLSTIVKHHNADRDGLVVAVHFNAVAGGVTDRPIGTEVLYFDQKHIASSLSSAMAKAGGFKNRGAKQHKGLAVLANTYEPAVLLEICFVNSKADVELYEKNFEAICQAICEVLAGVVGKGMKKPVIPEEKRKWAIKTGTFATKQACQLAINRCGTTGVVSPRWCKVYETNGKWYFVTGTFTAKQSADNALQKMKDSKIIYVGNVIEV